MGHAIEGKQIDVCQQRNEPRVVLGNSGVVRVLRVGSEVDDVCPGDVCLFFGGGKLDQFGYMELAHGYDLPGTPKTLDSYCFMRAPQFFRGNVRCMEIGDVPSSSRRMT